MRSKSQFWRIVVGLVVFSVAFGYVEAAVVVYLRSIYVPVRMHFYPALSPNELFPLLSLDQLRVLGPEHTMRLKIELAREFATLLMLAGVALIAGRKPREWLAALLVCFGIWDIAFYASLKLLLNWPASLFTWDILFLLPVPWVGPVLAPLLVSVAMVSAGLISLWREYGERPLQMTALRWISVVLGGVIVFAAFIYDFRNTASGGNPNAFHWGLFLIGLAVALFAFASSLRRRRKSA